MRPCSPSGPRSTSVRMSSIERSIAWKSSSPARIAASWATRGSSSRRASSTWATSPMRMSRRLARSSGGTSSVATNIPPPEPRRTSTSPESWSTLTASRRVGRLICICSARARSEGRRSPTRSSPSLIFSVICSTASSKVLRVLTGVNTIGCV